MDFRLIISFALAGLMLVSGIADALEAAAKNHARRRRYGEPEARR